MPRPVLPGMKGVIHKKAVYLAADMERPGADSAGSVIKQMTREKVVKLPFMSNNIWQLWIRRPENVPGEEPLHDDLVTACSYAHDYKSVLLEGDIKTYESILPDFHAKVNLSYIFYLANGQGLAQVSRTWHLCST